MKRKTILTLGAAATAAVIGALSIPAIAGGFGPNGNWGPQQMMRMMHDKGGPAMMQRASFGSHGPMGGNPMTDSALYKSFDTDADGAVSPEEAKAGIAGLQAKHDADGNGTLSQPEFEALFAEATRGFAERPFAMLDADKDGQLSAEELTFPVQMMTRMQAMQAPTAAPTAPETAQ
ncbi:EF hand domain-containing protein [Thioclava sp. ES.031]|uniref:EF-hand domain-containing protein n=1 Tax=Thioclava sp. ES.031 TaxID=1798203 RepID=UPI000BF6D5E2|nr:EF-hand domain-containing protein [Thioclava sp. ES.031]PFG65067.1 EF hand domain-containing protein [Thioclava sp. ES.031]